MAQVGSFIYFDKKFLPFNHNQAKFTLAYHSHTKSADIKAHLHSPIHGKCPSQSVYSQLNKFKIIGETYDKCCVILADALNMMDVAGKAQAMLDMPFSVRAIESLVRRRRDPYDIIQNEKVLCKAVACALKVLDQTETADISEGGEVIYANNEYTIFKIDYPDYDLLTAELQYKILPNVSATATTTKGSIAASMYLKYNLNSYTVITHGNGHARAIPRSTIYAHLSRMIDTKRKHPGMNHQQMCTQLIDYKWMAAMTIVQNGGDMNAAKDAMIKAQRPSVSNKVLKSFKQDISSQIQLPTPQSV